MSMGGSIVVNGSMVSIKGVSAFGVYAATEAALRSFARGVRGSQGPKYSLQRRGS